MVKYYPVFINLKKFKCLVIGGGKVAERKIATLLKYDADITIISPIITPTIKKIYKQKKIKLKLRKYRTADLKSFNFIITATDDNKLNMQIANIAGKMDILVNTAGNTNSSFIMPAAFNKGLIKIAVSTSGLNPCLAKIIKEEIEKNFDKNLEKYFKFISKIRQTILKEIKNKKDREELIKKISSNKILNLVRNSHPQVWITKIKNILQVKGLS